MKTEHSQLQEIVCRVFNISNLSSTTRERKYVDARKVYSKILRERGWSLCKIARSIEKDHTTIIHYLKEMKWLLIHDTQIIDFYFIIKKQHSHIIATTKEESFTPEELLKKIDLLKEEKNFLISALKNMEEELNKLNSFDNIFTSILERVPKEKIDEFETKVTRILNGM